MPIVWVRRLLRESDDMIKVDEKQQALLKDFFDKETSYQSEHVGYILLACILIGIPFIMFIMPFQIWSLRDDYGILGVCYALEISGLLSYVGKYSAFSETGKTRQVYDILKYMPICYDQYCLFKMLKVHKLCLRLMVLCLFCQTVFGLVFYHGLTFANLAVPIVSQYLIPLITVMITMIRRS